MSGAGDWATHQLAEFLAVFSYPDERSAIVGAVERAAEALEAEVGALLDSTGVVASVGFPRGEVPTAELVAAAATWRTVTCLSSLGPCRAAAVDVEGLDGVTLFVARYGHDELHPHELNLLRAMARVLAQAVLKQRSLEQERALVASLTERQRLLERLGRIQRSISHRAPLQEVLDGITQGAQEVLGAEVVGLRLIDVDQPDEFYLASVCGVSETDLAVVGRGPVGQGAGGRAIAENRLVIIDDYADDPDAVPVFRVNRMTTAMAAPVHENGVVVGSLVVASYQPGRRYSLLEQETLLALADHASLALTDARTVEAMREAQRVRDLFLAMVSHELKTPLTVVMGSLRTLQLHAGMLPADIEAEMYAAAFSRGRELERLIDRLLRGARADLAGARRTADVADLLAAAVSGFHHLRSLRVDVPAGLAVELDTVAFADVVGILAENAVAHSAPDATVAVSAAACGDHVVVRVTNPGALPAALDTASLFLPFQRGADVSSTGVGLGLYIAARLADSMGGSVDATSADGEVTFSLTVPRGLVAVPAYAVSG